jgi:penicillin-binding protein 1A
VFKPFVYALALKKGYTSSSIIYDTPLSYKTSDGRLWRPMNYDRRFHGRVTLSEALKESLNVATLRLAESIGVDPIAHIALKAGFAREVPRDLSIALGTFSTSPLRIAVAYTVFPNNGFITEPVFVREIRTKNGKVIEHNDSESIRLLPSDIAYRVTLMLTEVVRDGTGKAAAGLARAVAGKTGTTDGYRDAWFAGFTPDIVSVVWVGYDDNRSLGWGHTGGRLSAPIWKHYMRYLISGQKEFTFHPPKNVVKLYKRKKAKEDLDSIFDRLLWGKDEEE